jgi:CBS domain-containing protein
MASEQHLPLPSAKLSGDTAYYLPDAFTPQLVRADSPAIEVMTDLRRVPAATIDPDTALDEANQAMILRGVRSLLVIESDRRVLGIITATDLLGERPRQVLRERAIRQEVVRVRDVMTSASNLDAIAITDVLRAEVGHIVTSLRRSGRQHALVVDTDISGRHLIRGIFSASQIARQMGISVQATDIDRTFSEIEVAMKR